MSGRLPDHDVPLPVNYQDWEHLTFLHWRYDPATVQPLVPAGLTVQQWGGAALVGISPFRMARVRVPGLPPPPGWGAFPELNVRAYVRAPDGRDGIWFLGMVVPGPAFALGLRALGLPYVRSRSAVEIDGARWRYRFGTPRWLGPPRDAWFVAETQVGQPLTVAERTPMLESVTGRWSAFHRRAGIVWRTPVLHEPWPLHHAAVTGDLTAPLTWAGLPPPDGHPLAHASPGVHSDFGPPRPAGTRG
ncbi:MAG: DUF2071 domain-containing protein [Propionibacterium sp.]|nr:DUF2071 domain-containing protein [Propionibacterium sp.]